MVFVIHLVLFFQTTRSIEVKAKKIEVQLWPVGTRESWAGKNPLGCKTVRMHVLLCEMGGVWVVSHGEHVALPGRQMDPAERPCDIVEWVVVNESNNFPEDKLRLINFTAKPMAFVHEGACHVFVQINASRFQPAPDSSLRFVLVSKLGKMLSDKDAILASAMFANSLASKRETAAA